MKWKSTIGHKKYIILYLQKKWVSVQIANIDKIRLAVDVGKCISDEGLLSIYNICDKRIDIR